MAQFRNVSGRELDLRLPDWYAPKTVPPGELVDVEDDLVRRYDFNQPGVWEPVGTVPDVEHPVDPRAPQQAPSEPVEAAATLTAPTSSTPPADGAQAPSSNTDGE